MEDQNKTSRLYEDDQVFLTEDNQLILKGNDQREEKKLCEVSEDEVKNKIEELKKVFTELQSKVTEIIKDGNVTKAKLAEMKEELNNTAAIGDITQLQEKLEKKKATITEEDASEKGEPESSSQEKENEKSEATEETVDEVSDTEEASESVDDEDDPISYYRDIVKKAKDLSKQSDWPYVTMELDNLSHQWSDGPDIESDEVAKLFQKFNDTVDAFKERKQAHYEELKKQKQQNLEKKKELLKEFEGIVSNKTWTATKRVGQIKGRWNNIGPLPADKSEKLDDRFEELLNTFNEHKVDRLVQQRQKEEDNLMLKLTVLEKMERLAGGITHETKNWDELEEKFEDLTKQWKKIGRVPKEKSNHVWGRYKDAQDTYYDNKYKYDSDHQSKVDRFTHKKTKICEEAEALLEQEDIAKAARKINKLHRRWKKVGNLPQRDEDKLWDRFKAATDAFNERKAKNQDKIREQEEEHYHKKLKLIDKANEIKSTDDFEKGHRVMQDLMDRWKKIGPVARKKSNKIWKEFKGAMDQFYDRRRDHFKEVKKEQKENLKKKKEVLEELHELGQHEDPIEAVDIAKGLQEKFKNIGYVPIKQKNKMWKEYREACDVIYNRFRAAKSGDKFDQELAKADLDADERNQIQKLRKEFKKIKKEARQLEKEVLKYKEKKTYFKPSSGGNALLDEVEDKIEKAEKELETKQQKMDELTEQMDDIREEADN